MGPFSFPRRSRGFTLIEVVVVLAVIAILIAMAAMITRAVVATQKRSLTATRMATVDAAIVQFVMQQKRMPCPADGTLTVGNANNGVETARDDTTGCDTEAGGVVPWITLGLAEADALDGWDRRLTYRVQRVLGAKLGLDMSKCDPAGTNDVETLAGQAPNTCRAGCVNTDMATCTTPSNYLAGGGGRGLAVQNIAGTPVMTLPATGAGYVLISHGETGGGAYLNSGQLFVGTTTDGTQEQQNYANRAVQATYFDDALMEGAGPGHFDDMVLRPSVISVVTKAALGPRSH